MDFKEFFRRCQTESAVSDFESYLSYCVLGRDKGGECTLEDYSRMRDLAFEWRDEAAAMALYQMAKASEWKDGDWEGAMR